LHRQASALHPPSCLSAVPRRAAPYCRQNQGGPLWRAFPNVRVVPCVVNQGVSQAIVSEAQAPDREERPALSTAPALQVGVAGAYEEMPICAGTQPTSSVCWPRTTERDDRKVNEGRENASMKSISPIAPRTMVTIAAGCFLAGVIRKNTSLLFKPAEFQGILRR